MNLFTPVAALLTLFTAMSPTDNLALTPPMGWNSWNAVRCGITEEIVKTAADELVRTGLADRGYKYVVIDDCWQAPSRSATGELVAHPTKFPSGIKALREYVNSKGLKLGIYGSPGSRTCAMWYDGYPGHNLGSYGHVQQDADTFAAWGIEYLKYDWCLADKTEGLQHKPAFTEMHDALTKTGKSIVYSISEYGNTKPWEWAAPIANSWRTTADIRATWDSVSKIIDQQAELYPYSRPGAWNDPDMLQIGNGNFTHDENKSHFAMWAMLAAPLMIGAEIDKLPQGTIDILGNERIIAISQDKDGKQAGRIESVGGAELWFRKLSLGREAYAVLNNGAEAINVKLSLAAGSSDVADAWTGNAVEGPIVATVAAHGTAVFTHKHAGEELPTLSIV